MYKFVCESVYKFVCESVYKFVCESVYKFVCESAYKFVCESAYKFVCESVYKFVSQSAYKCTINRFWPEHIRQRVNSTYTYFASGLGVTSVAAYAATRATSVVRFMTGRPFVVSSYIISIVY